MSKSVIIGLSGQARSGKDTAAQFLVRNRGYAQYSFAKPIKDFFETLHGWNERHREGELKETPLTIGFSTSRFYEVLMDQFGEYLLGNETQPAALRSSKSVYDLAETWQDILRSKGALRATGTITVAEYSPRQAYQWFGTDLMRMHVRESVWIDQAESFCRQNPLVVVADVRFNNEANFIHEVGGLVVRVQRNNTQTVSQHVSETALNPSNIDIVVRNDKTIADLGAKITDIAYALENEQKYILPGVMV